MNMEDFSTIILGIVVWVAIPSILVAVGILIVRSAVWRTVRAGWRNVVFGLIVAVATALTVFILVYLAAWSELKQQVAVGDIAPHWVERMCSDFQEMRKALSDFALQHGHYPELLEEVPELKDREFRDGWDHPYQYRKTENGFSLMSLGRDGKPGGAGLDADIDSGVQFIRFQPTLSQFLYESAGSRTLFKVAIAASCFAGITCYMASARREKPYLTAAVSLTSVAVTVVGSVLVSIALLSIYLFENHH
jgi:hypothetical protein